MERAKLSDKAIALREEYFNKNNKDPRGWYYEEETMKEYEKFLEEELKK